MPNQLGCYIYCIIQTDKEESFGEILGDPGGLLRTVRYQDLGAVVTEALVKEYPVTREASLAHQQAIERVMKVGHSVLPVKFSTIAEDESEIIKQVLQTRYEEMKNLIKKIQGKHEIGLKCTWTDMPAVFEAITQENPAIAKLKGEITRQPAQQHYLAQIELGKMVEAALKQKKQTQAKRILDALRQSVYDIKENEIYGDEMFLKAALLVEESKEEAFFAEVSRLQEETGNGVKFKTIVGVPPFNFVTVVIRWERETKTDVSSG